MIVKGPGIKPASVFNDNMVNYDFPTPFVDWAGGNPAERNNIDGVGLADCMTGKETNDAFPNRYLYFRFPHYRTTVPHSSPVFGTRKRMHFYEQPGIPMLFDLSENDGEVENVAPSHADEHKQFWDQMLHCLKQVVSRMPKPNAEYDAEVYQAAKAARHTCHVGRPLQRSANARRGQTTVPQKSISDFGGMATRRALSTATTSITS